MTLRPLHGISVLALAAGLVIGPAAHSIHHGLEYSAAASSQSRIEHNGGPELRGDLPSSSAEGVVCTLCEMAGGRAVLAGEAPPAPDPSDSGPGILRTLTSSSAGRTPSDRGPPLSA